MKRVFLLTFMSLLSLFYSYADSYRVNVGESIRIYCEPDLPYNGVIDSAIFDFVDVNDKNYINLAYRNATDGFATVTGIAPTYGRSIQIWVYCIYSYFSPITHKIERVPLQFYHYVKVFGVAPEKVIITPSELTMRVNQTKILTATLEPADAKTSFTWGRVFLGGNPENFTLIPNGNTAYITADKPGFCLICVLTSNGKQGIAKIIAEEAIPKPTSIKLKEDKITLKEGETHQLEYIIQPGNADNAVSWTTSDAAIASVSESGIVTAHQQGKAVITATTVNKLEASADVFVNPVPPSPFDFPLSYDMKNHLLVLEVPDDVKVAFYDHKGNDLSHLIIYNSENCIINTTGLTEGRFILHFMKGDQIKKLQVKF